MNGVQEKVDQSEQELEQQGHRQDQHLGLSDQWPPVSGVGPGMKNNSYGFDGTNGFPNMGFNGAPDFSQMIQFMPNGMPNNAMGAFPNMMGKHFWDLLLKLRALIARNQACQEWD